MTDPGRWFVVANPVSGGGRARRYWPKLAAALARRGVAHDFASTRGPGDAVRLVAEAVAGGHRRLLALGGDGSFNELVNGLFADGAPPGDCLAAVAAQGSGNDWARAMQVPDDPEKLAACMARAATRAVDLGVAEDADGKRRAVFHNVAGAGLDALVLERTPRRGPRALAYLEGLARTIARYRAPRASIDDGWFDLVTVNPLSLAGALARLPKLFDGRLDGDPAFRVTRCRNVAIDAGPGCGVQVDGQPAGRTPVTFRMLPAALCALDCRDSAE